MQAQMTSTPRIASLSTPRPLPTGLISFTIRVRNAHLLSLPLLLVAPIILAPVFDGDVIPSFSVPWARMFLTPLYEYYSQFVQLQAASFLIMMATTFILHRLASRELHWSIHWLIALIAGIGGVSALTVFMPYAMALLLALPTLLIGLAVVVGGVIAALAGIVIAGVVILGGSALLIFVALLSLVAFTFIWAAGASNRRYEEDDFRYQQHLQRQPPTYRQNAGRYYQQVQEYYPSDE